MAARRTFFLWVICGLLIIPSFAGYVWGDNLSPAQEQEFIDAKTALEEAKKAQADKYSPDYLKKAGEFLDMAESARNEKNGATRFAQASRLARVHAELAEAVAQLKGEEEKLAAVNSELRKIKAEIERLKKGR